MISLTNLQKEKFLGPQVFEEGSVGCALKSKKGNIFTGINLQGKCAVGFCSEQAAIADMLKSDECRIDTIIAVHESGEILAPCGVCREMMLQINLQNKKTVVVLGKNKHLQLRDLLPEHWTNNLKR